MHIGFDISQTGAGKAGCGFFAHAMIKAMLEIAPEHRYSLFPSFGDFYFDSLMPILNPYHGREVHYGPRHLSRESAREFWIDADLAKALGYPDIVHANNFWCPVQLSDTSRLIYTFYDLGFAVNPDWSTEANRLGCFDGVFRSAVAADWVVAISVASRNHYLATFPHFPEDRVRVIYPCSRFADADARGRQPKALENIESERFWLCVGTIEPRKNQVRLAEAYARYVALGGARMPLVFAGGKGWLMDDFGGQLEKLGIAGDVVMTGYVSDEELVWLYRNCYGNVYPSLFEGFGLPVLEGMQFGAPTIASTSTSIPEVAGDAAILTDPKDVEALAQAMLKLYQDKTERARLSVLARQQASRFEWARSAAELMALYQEAVEAPKQTMRMVKCG